MGTVSVLLVRPIVRALGGAPPAAFWRATELTAAIVADDEARIAAPQFRAAWAEAARLTGDGALALAIAAATPPGAFGIIEYVCRSSATLGDALRQWVRYLNLLDDAVEVGLALDGDRAHLHVARESEAPAPASHELCWALVARQARELSTVPFRLQAVELAHPAPAGVDVARYRAWFDAPVVFGADHTRLSFPRAALEAALASSDPTLLAILTRAADELTRGLATDPTIAARVKRVLHELLRSGDADLDIVAKRLGLTGRSLQRRLKDEATSFADLRDVVRRELARRYLDEGLAIAEISFLLGFSEPSAFFRAYRRWTGEAPLASRRRALAGA
ncbi:MAG TPA: AraC family transcriptional regulator [Kofleriaceae bacterium]|nr:AraC family transcriptional regulator [Kofleriaceae bacterium]